MRKLLVVVDMQNDFVRGCLGTKEAEGVIPNIKKILDSWEGDIVFTRDTHDCSEKYLETMEGKKLPVPHCERNTQGWEIVDELKDYMPNPKGMYEIKDGNIGICYDYICDNGVMIIDKPVFGSIELGELAREKEYDEYVLVGVCTGICVISNAITIRTFEPNANISVIENACACVTPESHKIAIEAMKTLQINII